jgi:hydrogenase maturation protein HypF
MPYDRANTAMAEFPLCRSCATEYADPEDRRFHAETIACPICGPRLSHGISVIAAALLGGQIVALKGVGGFHLLCDATNEFAVVKLRNRKKRIAKPFAVMVANTESVQLFADPSSAESALLRDSARPIVLVRSRDRLAGSIAPRLGRVGLMLPPAPLHHLLFHALAKFPDGVTCLTEPQPYALVVTSANTAGEPLVITDAEARRTLAGFADLIVTHDRPIVSRADDSVMAVIAGAPAYVRRSRGAVPNPVDLGREGPPVLGVGAHLKATICVTRGREAFVSQHVGDLNTAATVRFYEETVHAMLELLDVAPELVACDLHPDYRSTVFAAKLGRPVLRVQHHVAHIASVAAEHLLSGPVIGVALDGHGCGEDGANWGGELILLNGPIWRRHGHLRPLATPGGDRAAREPWRMGVAALVALDRGIDAAVRFADVAGAVRLAAFLTSNPAGPTTTSMGRLFETAAALLGVCLHQSYEGQAAMELEALVRTPRRLPDGYQIVENVLDFSPLLRSLLEPGLSAQQGAETFHGTLIAGLADWIHACAVRTGRSNVVLGGGCLLNRVLADGLVAALREAGLIPWLPRAVPANDGGLCLGQAAMARAYLMTAARPFDLSWS